MVFREYLIIFWILEGDFLKDFEGEKIEDRFLLKLINILSLKIRFAPKLNFLIFQNII